MACSPVSFQVSQASIVPKTARPSRARSASPSTFSQQPLDLRAGEVRVQDEARALAHERLVPLRAQLVAAGRGAPVLPDDRAVERLAGRRIPHADGLALVRDADRREPAVRDAGVGQRLERERPRDVPDLLRVVLDPAGPGEMLLDLAVGAAHELGLVVEHEAGAARGALVDREDHGARSLPLPAQRTSTGCRKTGPNVRPSVAGRPAPAPASCWARDRSDRRTSCSSRLLL